MTAGLWFSVVNRWVEKEFFGNVERTLDHQLEILLSRSMLTSSLEIDRNQLENHSLISWCKATVVLKKNKTKINMSKFAIFIFAQFCFYVIWYLWYKATYCTWKQFNSKSWALITQHQVPFINTCEAKNGRNTHTQKWQNKCTNATSCSPVNPI